MSSPTLNQSVFAETIAPAFPDPPAVDAVERGADASLTARAIVSVTLLGGGIWYLLWKTAIYFLAAH